jgi:hypothetical protein
LLAPGVFQLTVPCDDVLLVRNSRGETFAEPVQALYVDFAPRAQNSSTFADAAGQRNQITFVTSCAVQRHQGDFRFVRTAGSIIATQTPSP